jgi:hypothetical protein
MSEARSDYRTLGDDDRRFSQPRGWHETGCTPSDADRLTEVPRRPDHRGGPMSKSWPAVVAAVLMSIGARNASASPIANDSFVYPPGALPGNIGGSGFVGPWNGDAGVLVQGASGLSHPLGLPSSGRMIGGAFNVNRNLGGPLTQSVFWASFMIQSTPGNDQVWLGLDTAVTQFPFITFGRRLNEYFIQNSTNTPLTVCCASGTGVTDLLTARVTKGGASTTVDLWVNKLPPLPPDLTAVMPPLPTLQVVNLQVQNGFLADEVRIGTTVQDVAAASASAPVPPWATATSGLVLALAGLGLTRRRARVASVL